MKAKPYLMLSRLVVSRSGCNVYDERFHSGVNIIRSNINACGKSSIANFISYILGGVVHRWTNEQKRCDHVFADIVVNNFTYCLRREIQPVGTPAIFVSDKQYSHAIESTEWIRFGPTRNSERQSFSQWFFDVLGYPAYKIDSDNNLTMHQLLRLLYLDQVTPDTQILRPEAYDNETTRQAIGDFLLGMDNIEYSRLRQEQLVLEKKVDITKQSIKSMYSILGTMATELSAQSITLRIENYENSISDLRKSAAAVEQESIQELTREHQNHITLIKERIEKFTNDLMLKQELCLSLKLEIEDNDLFVETLEQRLVSINNSVVARDTLMSVSFEYCPLCLTPIDNDSSADTCPLCKSQNDILTLSSTGHIRMKMELEFQIKETKSVNSRLKEQLVSLDHDLEMLKRQLGTDSEIYRSLYESNSIRESKLLVIAKMIGSLEEKIEAEQQNFKLAQKMASLQDISAEYQLEIERIQDLLDRLEAANYDRKEFVRTRLEKLTCELVKKDTGTESNFINPTGFTFDFSKNSFMINGAGKISESSSVILKSSFGLAMLLESISDPNYRLPCFMIFDQIEGQGMVMERRYRFQKTIIEACSTSKVPFQLIFTTSSLAPQFEGTPMCVGPCYTGSMKTLDFSKCTE